jgi:type VI secretion system secreted protein VgrG
MPVVQDLSQAQIAFQLAGGDLDRFRVIRYCGREGLCQLYRFEIELACAEPVAGFGEIVGQAAALSINTPHGERCFHGIVSHFEMTGETYDQTYYKAELVPSVWLLTRRYNSRIYQALSVPDIIADVLARAGFPSDHCSQMFQRSYVPREYCVQYRETDFNFICRLMEEEGIWWYFEQSAAAHVLVLADSPAAYAPIEGEADLIYQPPSGLNVSEEHVFRFRLGQSIRPGAVVLNDFNFENPKLRLQAQGDAGRDSALEFSDYPGEYCSQADGTELAKLRLEEFESSRILGLGLSNCHRLAAGRTFSLIEHPARAMNQAYLLTALVHQGKQATDRSSGGGNGRLSVLDARVHQALLAARNNDNAAVRELAEGLLQIAGRLQAGDQTAHRALTQWLYHAGQVSRDMTGAAAASGGNPLEALTIPNLLEDVARTSPLDLDVGVYECRFECIPAAAIYRPPRVTPWPVMRGSQTARVVGPANEEIHTDKYGRVKVQFNWDREGKFDEHSSCWIRVSQGSAGGQYGMLFLPRVGQEVVVDFLEGDPDKPLITGRVYNADQMPPYPLPAEKTKSVIKTNSSTGGGGSNELRFEDLKDKEQILLYAQKDLHVRVKHDRVENVENDRHLTVAGKKNELVKQGKSSVVKLDLSAEVGGKKSLKVAGDVAEEFACNHSEKVGAAYYLKSGKSIVVESGDNLTLKVGGNFVKIDSSGVTIWGTKVKINSGGSPGSGSLVALKAPDPVLEADVIQPGKDTTYSGGEQLAAATLGPDIAGIRFSSGQAEQATSWIEIELVDEAGQPVPNERYEVTAPDGQTILSGTLDQQGQAHMAIREPGTCQISFPGLDAAAWQRADAANTQAPAAGSSPGASATGRSTPSSGNAARPSDNARADGAAGGESGARE